MLCCYIISSLALFLYFSTAEDVSGFLPLKILEICLGGTESVLDTPKEEMVFESLENSINIIEVNIYLSNNKNKYLSFNMLLKQSVAMVLQPLGIAPI